MSTRDELAALIESGYAGDDSDCPYEHAPAIAEAILAAGYRKPRTITTAEELDTLAEGTIIACVKVNPLYPSVFLRAGSKRAPWLHLDPSDREDGETTVPSAEVLRWHGNGSATVLHEAQS